MNLFEADKEVLRSVHFSYAQTATNEFIKIFDGKRVFENPKSVDDIKKLVEYITGVAFPYSIGWIRTDKEILHKISPP